MEPPSEPNPSPQSASATSPLHSPNSHIYRTLQTYPFHSDASYQSGLSTILGHPSTPATANEISDNPDLILQAQCFYFARKHGLDPIDIIEYKNFLAITSALQQDQAHTPIKIQGNGQKKDESRTPPLERPDPVPRPSAPTPHTALTATSSSIPVQQDPQPLTQPQPQPPLPTTSTQTSSPSDPPPPYPTTFAEIVDLITQNKPIPGIEQIPDTVLDPGTSRQDHTAKRKKPWEKQSTMTTVTNNDGSASVSGAAEHTTATTTAEEVKGGKRSEQEETPRQIGAGPAPDKSQGVVRILQPGAIPDSGLLAKD